MRPANPNTVLARRVERSSGGRDAALARHVERSGAVNGIHVYVPTCHHFCLVRPLMPPESIEGPYVIGGSYAYETPLLRAAPSAAVGGAMPSSRATSSAAERLMGALFTFLPATASVLSARSLPELSGGPYVFQARTSQRAPSGALDPPPPACLPWPPPLLSPFSPGPGQTALPV
ncbi:hypothetical protein B0H14DRAFT_2642731 [Mycena olivaceomarginata]|nr:hypothetical protein B0H14DRAFT_2642731 [Mycena olivaceomarginata]